MNGKPGKNIYIVQFGTGANINLLPLASAQLAARLKQEKELLRKYSLREIIFRRPKDPGDLAKGMEKAAVVGFSLFLWNMNISLCAASEVKKKFPEALIVAGGPSAPKDRGLAEDFFRKNPSVDVICVGEGEEVLALLCNRYSRNEDFSDIPGIIYRDGKTKVIRRTAPAGDLFMDKLPSPYLDDAFDEFYRKYGSEFSGIILETNRGCPYECAFCTWGNLPSRAIREKPMEQVRGEIEWIGRNKISYIAMSDSNFGIRARDIELAEMLAGCKREYGVPDFISVSWTKNSPDKILKIAEIFKKNNIRFRVTLSLQSLKDDVLKAVSRYNMRRSVYKEIKDTYHRQRIYSYTELILGLPLETRDSYLSGIENSLSENVFHQLYVYPLFLFPNTRMASLKSRKKYGLESKIIENRYTKSKESDNMTKEFVEIVVGTSTMSRDEWIDSFVIGFYTLALHDDRIAFFILRYLKKKYGISITGLISFCRDVSFKYDLPILRKSFMRLENCAKGVQNEGRSHLIEPESYGNIPYDPPEGLFLELLLEREKFYPEFLCVTEMYLGSRSLNFDKEVLRDLFVFQESVMAHPKGPTEETLRLKYDWIDYFRFAFQLEENKLKLMPCALKVVDQNPCDGNPEKFLKSHFDVRGVPAFNQIFDDKGILVFPPVDMQDAGRKDSSVLMEAIT